jgi:hypothetical protein
VCLFCKSATKLHRKREILKFKLSLLKLLASKR